jgi:protoporphyrinogen IX oxidase
MLGADAYLWVKALHVIAVIAWMAGLFYLPRLFVYHCDAAIGSELSETFKTMERRLAKAIMTPAMLASAALGAVLLWDVWSWSVWVMLKLAGVAGLFAFHGWMIGFQKAFARDERPRSAKFFRAVNEVPTVLLIVIVVAVIVKPFS